ncbi:phosphate signaling complex protein PhoU [bacterium]|nr:phosphate signaling complex protein PhoU [candidate division CSSED10-310 bacterium]
MTVHFRREIEKLKKRLLALGAEVEEIVIMAVKSLQNKDLKIAERVKERDLGVDQLEVDIEEECLKILALHQPVAIDLRYVIAIMKMNNDLERIGDLSLNIAYRSAELAEIKNIQIPQEIFLLARKSKEMLTHSLDALINMDVKLALHVCQADDEVDDLHKEMYKQTRKNILANSSELDSQIRLLEISHQLERIADHATNLAEDVIYMVQGRIIRHKSVSSEEIIEASNHEPG